MQALVDVDLSGNQISVQGIPFLAAGIKASPSLAEVGLDNNDLREVGGQVLLEAVQVNGGLVKVRGVLGAMQLNMPVWLCNHADRLKQHHPMDPQVRLDNTNTSVALRQAIEDVLEPRLTAQTSHQT